MEGKTWGHFLQRETSCPKDASQNWSFLLPITFFLPPQLCSKLHVGIAYLCCMELHAKDTSCTHPTPPTMEQQLDPVPEKAKGGWAKMKSNWEALGSVDAAGAEPRQLPAQPSQQQNLEARRGSILLLTAHLGWEVLCGDTVLGKSAVRFVEGGSGGEVNGIWGLKPWNQTTVKSRICKPGSKEQSFSIEYWACKPNQLKSPLVNEDVEAK